MMIGMSSKDSLVAIMAELRQHEVSALGAEIDTLVGGASGAEDPEAGQQELIDAGLSFLVNLLEPLRACLDQVTGDAASLRAKGGDWTALAASLRATVPQIDQTADSTRATWTGAAATAFDSTMHEFTDTVTGAAEACNRVAQLLQVSAELMSGAQNLITDLIGRVIEYMITAEAAGAASAAFTFGASEAAAHASILGEVAGSVERAISIVDQVTALLQRIGKALEDVASVFSAVAKLLDTLAKQTTDLATSRTVPGTDEQASS